MKIGGKGRGDNQSYTEQNRYYTIANYHEKITIQLEKWFISGKLIYRDAKETFESFKKKNYRKKSNNKTNKWYFLRNNTCILAIVSV